MHRLCEIRTPCEVVTRVSLRGSREARILRMSLSVTSGDEELVTLAGRPADLMQFLLASIYAVDDQVSVLVGTSAVDREWVKAYLSELRKHPGYPLYRELGRLRVEEVEARLKAARRGKKAPERPAKKGKTVRAPRRRAR